MTNIYHNLNLYSNKYAVNHYLTCLIGEKNTIFNHLFTEDKEEHVSILEEAAALRAVSVREHLAAVGSNNSMEMVAIAILAELQEEQDREVALTLNQIENMVG